MKPEPRITIFLPSGIDCENAMDFEERIKRLAKECEVTVEIEHDDFPEDGGDVFSRISENGREFPTAANN